MHRRLILMRHAKSSWDSGASTDHGRPLTPRGQRDAPAMAQELVTEGWVPDHVVSSDAQRTRETWEAMESLFGEEIHVHFERGLYHAGLPALQASSLRWSDGWGTVLALGHNPGWSDAASSLASTFVEMTTANCALLEGEGEAWIDALRGRWRLVKLLRPRDPR
jgi:phosphohistidine phosphatase